MLGVVRQCLGGKTMLGVGEAKAWGGKTMLGVVRQCLG